MGDNKMTNGMATSRRNFIKGAGITLAGATALSIMGCASGNSSSASSSSQKWDGEYDVIVVGAGIAGVTAAITVADEGNDIIVRPHERACPRHAQRNGDRRGGMAGHKRVMHALAGLWKAGKAAVLPQAGKIRLATCQQLMDIRLMTHIKNQAVFPGIIYGFNGNGQLHHA